MAIYQSKMALLGNIIDYAGTFPPASLSLNDALRESTDFRNEALSCWLYSKMSLFVSDLKKLSSHHFLESHPKAAPWYFTALAGKEVPTESKAFLEFVKSDLAFIHQFNDESGDGGGHRTILSYEIKLPSDVTSRCIEELGGLFSTGTGQVVHPYFELDGEGSLMNLLSSHWPNKKLRPGIKIRLGGKTSPNYQFISEVISFVTKHDYRFKATQGLHHSLTRDHETGFVNLFAVLTLSQTFKGEMTKPKIIECLEEREPSAFRFHLRSFSWREFIVGIDEIDKARRFHRGSFGSCSLREPEESLNRIYPS